MPLYTKTDEILLLYRRFRKLWVLQADMMHPDDLKDANEKLISMSDRLARMEESIFTRGNIHGVIINGGIND